MLAAKHDWKAEELAVCIVARFMSGGVNPTESVKSWIGAITDYQSGPQDKFGTPLYTNGALNRWRNEARVILYGPQPEQLQLEQQREERERQETSRLLEQEQRRMEEIKREMEALDKLPEPEFTQLHTAAEREHWRYKQTMPPKEFEKLVRQQMVKFRREGHQVGA